MKVLGYMLSLAAPATIIVALVACGPAPASQDADPSCAPLRYKPCVIAEPPLPPQLWPWHCTNGAALGRVWCAVCEPHQELFCRVDDVACVDDCKTCQVPGWPACLPQDDADDFGVEDLSS